MGTWHSCIGRRFASADYIQSNLVLAAHLILLSLILGCGGSNSTTGTALTIATASLPNGTVGVAYSSTVSATGGTAPYSWALSSGSLPAGLSLSSAGNISGTPSAAGATNFTVRVTDAANGSASAQLGLMVFAPPTVVTSSLPAGTEGVAYSSAVSATGGSLPYGWTISSGSLPLGLSVSTRGQISGTPSALGPATFGESHGRKQTFRDCTTRHCSRVPRRSEPTSSRFLKSTELRRRIVQLRLDGFFSRAKSPNVLSPSVKAARSAITSRM